MGKSNRNRRARKAVAGMKKSSMSTNTKVTIGLVLVAVLAIGALVFFNRGEDGSGSVSMKTLVRPDSHKLQTATDNKVTITEFLDFQCPGCGTAYPSVEKLRKEYEGRITYVIRNFPLEMHQNANPAAKAFEAAAMQGKSVEMYSKLFENQQKWSNSNDAAEIFSGYASELGLDVEKFNTDVDSTTVANRISADQKDGEKAKITGTPTFFINTNKFSGTLSYENLKKAVDKALKK